MDVEWLMEKHLGVWSPVLFASWVLFSFQCSWISKRNHLVVFYANTSTCPHHWLRIKGYLFFSPSLGVKYPCISSCREMRRESIVHTWCFHVWSAPQMRLCCKASLELSMASSWIVPSSQRYTILQTSKGRLIEKCVDSWKNIPSYEYN